MIQKPIGFELSVSARNDGTIEAMYICLRNEKVVRTQEISEDILLVDYNASDEVVGIEILAPVKMNQIAKLVEPQQRRQLSKFVRKAAPRELVHS